jgi:adenylate kinase
VKTQTIILHGRSGAGKGTQAALLKEYLEKNDTSHPVVYISTGQAFRQFMNGNTYAARCTKKILDEGGFLPEFLAVWVWGDSLNQYIHTGEEHVIFDGAARRPAEGPMMDSALTFFRRSEPAVVVINVSRERAIEHLKKRGRYDDNDTDIKSRLDLYESEVVPTLQYFKENPRYRYIEINGEQDVHIVHGDIIKALGL